MISEMLDKDKIRLYITKKEDKWREIFALSNLTNHDLILNPNVLGKF